MKNLLLGLFLAIAPLSIAIANPDETATQATLYERLGGMEGITEIITTTVDLHMENPTIAAYVNHVDQAWLIQSVTEFFAAGTGGPNEYTGVDMHSAHAHMDLTDEEFDSAVADVLAALKVHDIDDVSYAEVDVILNSFRGQIVTAP